MRLKFQICIRSIAVLMLLWGWAWSGGVQLVTAEDSQGLSLFDVTVSAASFNPSVGDTVTLTYQLSRSATVTIKVFDPDQELIRVLADGVTRDGGTNQEAWDGKDDRGVLVPNEAYFLPSLLRNLLPASRWCTIRSPLAGASNLI